MSGRVIRSASRGEHYAQLWRVVDGAVRDALKSHPDYLTRKGRGSARVSLVKRITGTVLSFAYEKARGRTAAATESVDTTTPPVPPSFGGTAGVSQPRLPPHPSWHCRIGRVTPKAAAA